MLAGAGVHILTRRSRSAREARRPHANLHYAMLTRRADGPWLDPQQWPESAARAVGSWWPAWHDWLLRQGSRRLVKTRTPAKADVLCEAPGEFVHVRYSD